MKGHVFSSLNGPRGSFYSYCCIQEGYLCFLMNVGGRGGAFPNSSYTNEAHVLIISQENDGTTLTITRANDSSSSLLNDTKVRDCVTMVSDIYRADLSYTFFPAIVGDIPMPGNTGVQGGNVWIRPIEVMGYNGPYLDNNLICYHQNDFINQSEHPVEVNGATGTFLFLTPALRTTYPNFMNIAVRWE